MTPEQKKAQALKGVKGRLGPISRRIAERHEGGTGMCVYFLEQPPDAP